MGTTYASYGESVTLIAALLDFDAGSDLIATAGHDLGDSIQGPFRLYGPEDPRAILSLEGIISKPDNIKGIRRIRKSRDKGLVDIVPLLFGFWYLRPLRQTGHTAQTARR